MPDAGPFANNQRLVTDCRLTSDTIDATVTLDGVDTAFTSMRLL